MEAEINSQDDFTEYIKKLPEKERCIYRVGIELDLCRNLEHVCPYMGEDTYSLSSGIKKECKRQRILRLKKLF